MPGPGRFVSTLPRPTQVQLITFTLFGDGTSSSPSESFCAAATIPSRGLFNAKRASHMKQASETILPNSLTNIVHSPTCIPPLKEDWIVAKSAACLPLEFFSVAMACFFAASNSAEAAVSFLNWTAAPAMTSSICLVSDSNAVPFSAAAS